MNVHLFIPCFIDQFYPETGFHAIKVLETAGVNVSYNYQQTCCGQPAFNSGYWKEAKQLALKFMNDFGEANYIVSPSASCVAYIRKYYRKLFEHDEAMLKKVDKLGQSTFELTDFLVNILQSPKIVARFPHKVTYHDSCHALREYGIRSEPRELLKKVKDIELLEMESTETCCGFGGTFMLKFKNISAAMTEQKVEKAMATGAEFIVSTEASCLLNMESYIRKKRLPVKTIHIADVLAQNI